MPQPMRRGRITDPNKYLNLNSNLCCFVFDFCQYPLLITQPPVSQCEGMASGRMLLSQLRSAVAAHAPRCGAAPAMRTNMPSMAAGDPRFPGPQPTWSAQCESLGARPPADTQACQAHLAGTPEPPRESPAVVPVVGVSTIESWCGPAPSPDPPGAWSRVRWLGPAWQARTRLALARVASHPDGHVAWAFS